MKNGPNAVGDPSQAKAGEPVVALEFHEIANLFPLMQGTAYDEFRDDVARHGQREPIELYEGKILDGRNRYRACKDLKIPPTLKDWPGGGSPVAYVVSKNLRRRHLSSSQLAAIAVEAEALLAREAEGRKRVGKSADGQAGGRGRRKNPPQKSGEGKGGTRKHKGEAAEQAAKLTGTNRQYVTDAKAIKREAPELFEEVRRGEKSLPQAKREVKCSRKTKDAEEPHAGPTAAPDPPALPGCEVVCGDPLEELAKLKADSFRLAFADPHSFAAGDSSAPGPTERLSGRSYLNWAKKWIALCVPLLTPDGSLWLLVEDEHADHYGVLLRAAGLTRRAWIKVQCGSVTRPRNVNRCSRHLLHCTRNPDQFVFHDEPLTEEPPPSGDSRFQPWDDVWVLPDLRDTDPERLPDFPVQRPLALVRPVVLCGTDAGDTVLEPFAGSATAGVIAAGSGRHYLGIQSDPRLADLARQRLTGVTAAGQV